MPMILVSSEARDALRQHLVGEASPGWELPPQADGRVVIDLGWPTIKRLQAISLKGESLSDVILRLSLTADRPKH